LILAVFNRVFAATPDALRPWRWPLLTSFALISLVMLFGMVTRLEINMSLEALFPEDDPVKVALDHFRHEFGSDDGVYVVYQPVDGDVFSYQSLLALQRLTADLESPAGVAGLPRDNSLTKMIDSITTLGNSRYQMAEGNTLMSRRLWVSGVPETAIGLAELKQQAYRQQSFRQMFFSNDGRTGGFLIKTHFGTLVDDSNTLFDDAPELLIEDFSLVVDSSSPQHEKRFKDVQMEEYTRFMNDLKIVLEQKKYTQHLTFYPVGNAPMMDFFMQSMWQSALLVFFMMVVIVVLLRSLLGSFSAVLWPMLIIVGSLFWTIGGAAWLGLEETSMVMLTAMLIVTVGVADSVHILSAYLFFRRQGEDHDASMRKAYRKTGVPILITSITTMSGMLALTVTGLPQFVAFGVMSAVGVFMAWLFSWLILPLCLDIWHPEDCSYETAASKPSGWRWLLSAYWLPPLLSRIPPWVARYPWAFAGFFMAAFVVFVVGTARVQVDTNIIALTGENSRLRVAYELVDDQMMGAQNLEIMIDSGTVDGLKSVELLQAIDRLESRLLQNHSQFVKKTFSLAGVVKDTHQIMQGGDESAYRVPSNAVLVHQLLFLFDNANPEDRRKLVNDSFSKSHVSLQLKNAGSYEYQEFFTAVAEDIQRIFGPLKDDYPHLKVTLTGNLALIMDLSQKMSESQFKGFGFAIVVISVIMIVTLGSFQGGMISLIPNMLPAVFTFGLMGLLGIPLDTDTLVIAPLIIGLAVDDTIHFITHYRDAWFAYGNIEKALLNTLQEVGQAVTFTSLILGLGFFMLSFSDYGGLSKIGSFGALAIFVALACDLFFLPALVWLVKPDFGVKK
jgi:uncharacterized protein